LSHGCFFIVKRVMMNSVLIVYQSECRDSPEKILISTGE